MESSVTRDGEMQKAGPGEMASSLKSESMFLVHVGSHGLLSSVRAEVAGAEGQCCHRLGPGMQIKVSGRGLPLLLPQAFLKLSWPSVELLELESQFAGSFLRGQDETGCGSV